MFPQKTLCALSVLIVALTPLASAQAQDSGILMISEVMASNDSGLVDVFDSHSDWIEIHNPSNDAVSLSGLFLTDNKNLLQRWAFPDVSVPASGYLVVFASGRNVVDAESGEIHTNFRLSSQGDYLALVGADGTTIDEIENGIPAQKPDTSWGVGSFSKTVSDPVIKAGAPTRWHVPSGEPTHDWRSIDFDDSGWTQGNSGIGYGYPELVGEGGDTKTVMRGVNASIFIRFPFEITDASLVTAMTLRLQYEDGFVAYLNGEEIARANAPGTLPFDATATEANPDEAAVQFESFPVNFTGKLRTGPNILAFHGLNLSAKGSNSSDFLILPELDIERLESKGEESYGYLESPTPGSPNGAIAYERYAREPQFDVERGFHESPFTVTIDSEEPGADLVYTTDSSTPSADNGVRIRAASPDELVSAKVDISTTTIVRAVSVKPDLPPYKSVTASYIFLEDVLDQPRVPEGYPSSWFAAGSADYQMDPDIVDEIYTRDELKQSLRSLPTISLVTDIPNLFDQRTGIQINPQRTGPTWEKPSSIELIDFEDAGPEQFDCGWRMSGNASRSPSRPKHNLRIVFRPQYDKTPLEYPLFGTLEVQRFRTFILRGFNGDSWVHPSNFSNGQYIRDQWYRDAHRAMGYEETLQREVHVYYNGLYWGIHHLFERTEDDFAVEHFGGETYEWDGIRITAGGNLTTIDGTLDAWNETRNLARAEDYEGVQRYLDIDEFIDYLLLNFYGGNGDWDQNNVRAMRRKPNGVWHFFCHDSERAGLNAGSGSLTINVTNKNTSRGPTEMHQRLSRNEDYRIRFADRVQKHLFGDGVLTPENAKALWQARAEGVRDSLKAESARWGDAHRSRPMTLEEWEPLVEREYNTWFPRRTEITIGQLRQRDLYPDILAPVLGQHGGVISPEFDLVITNEEGDIVFTLDGTDPRLPGGDVNPTAVRRGGATQSVEVFSAGSDWKFLDTGEDLGSSNLTAGTQGFDEQNWKHASFDDSAWKTGAAPLGYGGIGSADLATEVDYGGNRANRHLTTYFRRTFQVSNPAIVTAAQIHLMKDDGAIVYVNGKEVARVGIPEGEVSFDTLASENVSGASESAFNSVSISANGFRQGTNVIAVEVHQVSKGSSDLGFDLALNVTQLNDENGPVRISPTTTVKARSLHSGEWSALTEATFVSGLAPTPESLIVSELYYNPSPQQTLNWSNRSSPTMMTSSSLNCIIFPRTRLI